MPEPDKESNGGRFAGSKEKSAPRDISFGAPQRCRKAGPPKRPCNRLRGSSSTLLGSRPVPKGSASRRSPRLESSLALNQTNLDGAYRIIPANKTVRDTVRSENVPPGRLPR